MPYRMHSEYLRQLYMNNDLAEGRLHVAGKPVALADIRVPWFVVGTVRDHVAPWPSVYKLHLLSEAELTFALTSGGHNAGVVSEPGHPRRRFQIATRVPGYRYVDAERWRSETPLHQGSPGGLPGSNGWSSARPVAWRRRRWVAHMRARPRRWTMRQAPTCGCDERISPVFFRAAVRRDRQAVACPATT